MSSFSPNPTIARILRQWDTSMELSFLLVEDTLKRLWIVETCPTGTCFWTVAQAAKLPRGERTRMALYEAVQIGRRLERLRNLTLRPRFIRRAAQREETWELRPQAPRGLSRETREQLEIVESPYAVTAESRG